MGLQRVGLNLAMEQQQSNTGASLLVQWQRICLPMQKMQVQSLSGEYSLTEEMATHSSILAWKIPWTEEPGGQATVHGGLRVGDNLVTKQQLQSNSKQTVSLGSAAILANY